MGEAEFAAWGWRIPFLLSIFLLAISVWIRLQMQESPAFKKMKEEGTGSKAPLSEAFGQWKNAKIALIALFGLTMGQAVVWYTGQFYALFLHPEHPQGRSLLGQRADRLGAHRRHGRLHLLRLALGQDRPQADHPGRLPDRGTDLLPALRRPDPGRRNPGLAAAHENVKVQVVADPATCGSVFDPVGVRTFTAPCDIARRTLAQQAIVYTQAPAPAGTPAKVIVNGKDVAIDATFAATIAKEAVAAGYPAPGDARIVKTGFFGALFNAQSLTVIAILTVLIIYVTMVYGPVAAALVELFPTRIRYTGMSLPYHIGNGWFGGLLPATSFAMVAGTGDIFYGLWYPIVFALATFVIGMLLVPETKDRDIMTYEN